MIGFWISLLALIWTSTLLFAFTGNHVWVLDPDRGPDLAFNERTDPDLVDLRQFPKL